MANQLEMLIAAWSVNPLFVSGAVLLLPVVLTLCFRWLALQFPEAKQRKVWAAYRGFGRFILAITVASWWVDWDLHSRSDLISMVGRRWPEALEHFPFETTFFWALPTVSLGIFLLQCYTVDKSILGLKWTATDTLRQVWWRLVSFVIPLLIVAAGFGAILDGNVKGIVWLLTAGVVARVGTGFLRRAEGLKLNALKSGEFRNRALSIASRMGVSLGRVYVVPAGKGHLTNAFGMSNAIAVTDNLGKYLNKAQIEFVIAHELAHVKLKHGRKQLLVVIAIFSAIALLLFRFRQPALTFRPLVQLVVMIGPLTAVYFCSRRFEYSADREAIDYTGDPEMAVQALAKLHQSRELPAADDRLTELFMTHPTFRKRVQAIANSEHLPADRLAQILEDAGMLDSTVRSR